MSWITIKKLGEVGALTIDLNHGRNVASITVYAVSDESIYGVGNFESVYLLLTLIENRQISGYSVAFGNVFVQVYQIEHGVVFESMCRVCYMTHQQVLELTTELKTALGS